MVDSFNPDQKTPNLLENNKLGVVVEKQPGQFRDSIHFYAFLLSEKV
jgi:hypothetical protein